MIVYDLMDTIKDSYICICSGDAVLYIEGNCDKSRRLSECFTEIGNMEVLSINPRDFIFENPEHKLSMLCIDVVNQKSLNYRLDQILYKNKYGENVLIAIYKNYELIARIWKGEACKLSLYTDIDFTFNTYPNSKSKLYDINKDQEVKLEFHNKKIDESPNGSRSNIEYIEVDLMLE